MGWWIFVRSALEALTRPRADVEACDRAIEQLTAGSVIGAAVHRSSDAVRDSWTNSRARALALSVAGVFAIDSASGWRRGGWAVAVASATILALDAVKPTPVGPLSWMLPAAMGAAGLLAMAAAAPLARAAADRRARAVSRGMTS